VDYGELIIVKDVQVPKMVVVCQTLIVDCGLFISHAFHDLLFIITYTYQVVIIMDSTYLFPLLVHKEIKWMSGSNDEWHGISIEL